MERLVSNTDEPRTVTRPYPGGLAMPPTLDDDLLELCEMSMDGPQSPVADSASDDDGDDGTIIMNIGELLELQKPPTKVKRRPLWRLKARPEGHPLPEAESLQLNSIAHHGVKQVSTGAWLVSTAVLLATLVVFLG